MAKEGNVRDICPRRTLLLHNHSVILLKECPQALSPEMALKKIEELKKVRTRIELAELLEVKPSRLAYELYKKKDSDRYQHFEIPKKYGGTREILAPNPTLKTIQRRLAIYLQDCLEEVIASTDSERHRGGGIKLGFSHGFMRDRTIITNARPHRAKRFVFNCDIVDFFGTINFGRVRGFFIKDKQFALAQEIATFLAQISCFQNVLPQGSPCSPVIANLIARKLDIKLGRLAYQTGMTYTRYADDLTFSTNKKIFSHSVGVQDASGFWRAGTELTKIVRASGFELNPNKTRLQQRDSHQEVTGLTVNRKVNTNSSYRYTARAMVNSVLKTGEFCFSYSIKNAPESLEAPEKKKGNLKQLLGILSHIDYVDRFNFELRKSNLAHLANKKNQKAVDDQLFPSLSRQETFKKFVYFYWFYACDEPVIICEGKTDNIYLKCAIKALKLRYPDLISNDKNNEKLKIRFFEYKESRAKSLSQLSGGVGGLCHFLENYHKYLNGAFFAPKPKHPVIVLIDNDNGGQSVYSKVAGITKKKKPTGKESFIRIEKNLYIIPTPLGPEGQQTAIEDFFDKAVLDEQLNGKSFSRDDDFDKSKFYGKAAFSRDVVLKNREKIDFQGFDSILSRINSVLRDYHLTP
ncbi:hypothetical protein LMG26686_01367 [Achromobacter mucicolens]|uniref:retron Ec67 family RNA-directed DNA polymerase/endonuclease n=1 Tax=Achromobacter mucicolens TaxID=1389922 RepID=UPI0014680479|nr:retron Ec67 family RNA-directed DNA polymerase/endonuclease [Achromobacter mucicolens]CAB3839319.1 hypothetical protein LMG26686_01367 [Achromobacter mucicolens]